MSRRPEVTAKMAIAMVGLVFLLGMALGYVLGRVS